MNTKLMLILFLVINLMFGVYINLEQADSTIIKFIQDNEQIIKEYKDEDKTWLSNVKTAIDGVWDSIGSLVDMGKLLISIFLTGLNPFTMTEDIQCTNCIWKMLQYAISIFRSLFYVILMFEGYEYFKNKKTN